jgi:valyl-tRNA synthetase
MQLPNQYNPKEAELRLQKFWEKNKIYKFNINSKKIVYSIDTPPPTISGNIHMGHAFSYAQADFIARFQRMNNKEVFYPFGFDNNGLATERLVEKERNIKAQMMGREEFIKICLEVSKKYESMFKNFWQSLGLSCDWSLLYSTIDNCSRKISQISFIELYKKKREYRKRTPFMWCPQCQTAIAQVEMKDKETESELVYIKFDTSIKEQITIATTRPELMPACVMVHVHPDDKRYQKFIGKKAKIPFFNYEVDIRANKDVNPEFGSGAVYHCTFGDMDDAKWLEEFNVQAIEIMNKDGTLNEKAGKYQGLTSKQVRKQIIKDLEKAGRIEKKEPIKHVVNTHERCDTEIEILMTEQWFIKYLDLKDKFLELGNRLKWFPEHMKVRYENWINGLKWDWCISRQRFFGVPFPVWYCKKCNEIILAEESQLPVDPLKDKPLKPCKCGSKEFTPEKDILDTWATSSLTPHINAKWKHDNKFFKKLFPMSLRPQAHDIITFWLFNTVVKSFLHNNSLPWHDVMISGHGLDPHGKKMSKSKGNIVNPIEVIKKYNADCLRFWAAGSKLGDDLPYMEKDLVTGQKFITKLWNASKLAFMHLKEYKPRLKTKITELEIIDKWLLSQLQRLIKISTDSFERYDYSKPKLETEKFFWHVFCDYYLEIVKDRLYNEEKRGKKAKESAQYTLYYSLLTILKLMAPIMPHITEELYQLYYKKNEKEESIHISHWPKYNKNLIDEKSEKIGNLVIYIVEQSRRAKTEKNLSLKTPIQKIIFKSKISNKNFELVKDDIIGATKAGEIVYERLDVKSNIDYECNVIL